MTLQAVERWFAYAGPGDELVYHRGDLASDRARDRELDRVARRLLAASEAKTYRVSPCGHVRGERPGEALVRLMQRPNPDVQGYDYLAVRM